MYIRILVVFLIVFNGIVKNDVVIEWRNDKKLSLSDFNAPVDESSDAVAVTASGITFSFSIKESNGEYFSFEATAKAHFYPDKSWFNRTEGNNHILAHEQLHFDITELNVRKMRYEISRLKLSQNIKKQLRQLHQEANVLLAEMQNDYDTQTEHSMNVEAQKKWAEFVEIELQRFHDYRSE